MIDLKTCNWCVWGCKNVYDTFGHIHEAFYRALKFRYPYRQVLWVDYQDDISRVDFSNTFFISCNVSDLTLIPKRLDCFYAVHNVNDRVKGHIGEQFSELSVLNYGVLCLATPDLRSYTNEICPDALMAQHVQEKNHGSVMFRWGTDLLPHEIQANKPLRVFNRDSRVVTYVGSCGDQTREGFKAACQENGIKFTEIGGFGHGGEKPSISENVRLIQRSYMAPAIVHEIQLESGYIPCRIFKNISYGQFGMTNSPHVNAIFGGRLICNTDTYRLFYEARERLQSMPLQELHSLMDEVAAKHTYLNKIDILLTAAKIMLEAR